MGLRYLRWAMFACVFAVAAYASIRGGGGLARDVGDSGVGSIRATPSPASASYPSMPAIDAGALGLRTRTRGTPLTDAEAARFLTQATFGPTTAEIANLRAIGYSKWLEEQLSEVTAPPSLILPHLEQLLAKGIPATSIDQKNRRNYWLWQATTAHDQLRLRMSFALSQIFVTSDLDLPNRIVSAYRVADYQDMLNKDAFASYRDLLEDVTLHPATGYFLTYAGNRKTDAVNNLAPDENYAREVMQLFSVGLYQRNRDFTPVLDSKGRTIPTYNQAVVSAMARIFTGWTYAGQTDKNYGESDFNNNDPMECHPAFHDSASKKIFNGIVINSGDDCTADLAQTLDALANHANTAPFISRQLIQRFVTSNPSPAYVARVVDAWEANNGDLGKVLRAILLDVEARVPPPNDALYGKPREPIINLTTLWRAYSARYTPPSTGEIKFTFGNAGDLTTSISQDSLRAPSVFNFFSPDFQLSSTGIFAPEFQIFTEATYLGAVTQHDELVWLNTIDQPPPVKMVPVLDLGPLITLAQAKNYPGMVDAVNVLLFYGKLSSASQATMVDMLEQLAATGQTASECARSLIEVALDSPEFAIQR